MASPTEKHLKTTGAKLSSSIDGAEYKHAMLDLLFLKYVSASRNAIDRTQYGADLVACL